ncbi:flagellar hook-basal body complex protein FliE [Acidithiobacillus caldus]
MPIPAISLTSSTMANMLEQLRALTVPQTGQTPLVPATAWRSDASGSGFSELIRKGLAEVSSAQAASNAEQRAFAAGVPEAPSLAQTMLSMQKSDIAFQELIAIRNELTRGYETLISMPV